MNTLTGVSLIIQLPSIRSFIIVINLSDLWLVQLFTLESQVLMLHCKFDLGDWSHLDEFNETEECWEIANLFSVIEGWKMCSEIEIIPMQTRGKWLVKRFRRCHRPLGPFRFGRTEIGFQVKGFYSKKFFLCVCCCCVVFFDGEEFSNKIPDWGGKKCETMSLTDADLVSCSHYLWVLAVLSQFDFVHLLYDSFSWNSFNALIQKISH